MEQGSTRLRVESVQRDEVDGVVGEESFQPALDSQPDYVARWPVGEDQLPVKLLPECGELRSCRVLQHSVVEGPVLTADGPQLGEGRPRLDETVAADIGGGEQAGDL